jgi:RNA polymerase-associated protein
MTLYSGTDCPYSHAVRIVLREKDVECEYRFLDGPRKLESIAEFNPYMETPTLLDREVVLYDAGLICEYLDERLPHPPLMAVDPVGRSRIRLLIHRLRRDWIDPIKKLAGRNDRLSKTNRTLIRDGLISISPVFRDQAYLIGDDYTMADAFIAPLLWRLPALGIKLPKPAAPLEKYSERLFERTAFSESLTEVESGLRAGA